MCTYNPILFNLFVKMYSKFFPRRRFNEVNKFKAKNRLQNNHSPRKKFVYVLPKFGRMYVGLCGCVCMCVFTITGTLFSLEISNFGITFIMWISKNSFLKFLKNCFYAELLLFINISLKFLCNFEEQLRINKLR